MISLPRVDTRTGLSLPEAPPSDRTFTVVGHEVRPDPENLRWYCDVDILVPGDAYTPFVRLALARYQPDSLAGLELSPVVQLDYMQLYPDRYASVFRFSESIADVYVSGTTYEGGRFKRTRVDTTPSGSVIEAQVEQRRDPTCEFTDELFGWIPVPGVAPVVLTYRRGIARVAPTWAGRRRHLDRGPPAYRDSRVRAVRPEGRDWHWQVSAPARLRGGDRRPLPPRGRPVGDGGRGVTARAGSAAIAVAALTISASPAPWRARLRRRSGQA